jgi:hypothetical protein
VADATRDAMSWSSRLFGEIAAGESASHARTLDAADVELVDLRSP